MATTGPTIDMLQGIREARRRLAQAIGGIEAVERLRRAATRADGEGLARCSRPPVTLGPPHLTGHERS